MNTPITILPGAVLAPDSFYAALDKLQWRRMDQTPRDEYFASDVGQPYTYGTGAGQRTYHPQPWTTSLRILQVMAERFAGVDNLELVFLNRYKDGKDQLGWHADDSPEMDDARPIVIMSLGATREIWFRTNGYPTSVDKVTMASGDVIVMAPGMQDTHQHRIPKSHLHDCGPRISLTFRGIAPSTP